MPLVRILNMMGLVSVIAGISCASVSEDGKEWITPPEGNEESSELGVTEQALTGTNQACACITPGVWRDTLVVPDGWQAVHCQALCQARGASHVQLHCLNDTGTRHTLGLLRPTSQTPPDPSPDSCGW